VTVNDLAGLRADGARHRTARLKLTLKRLVDVFGAAAG
jgi:hypothetical protein